MSCVEPLSFDLTGKNALISHGAQGLGWQLARALGEAGARIMLCDRRAADLEAACAELQAGGIDARWVAADVGLEADIDHLVAETLQRMGDIDILVDSMNSMESVGVLLSQRVVHSSMMGRRSGHILALAGVVDHAQQDECNRATRALDALWGPFNIQVNTLCHAVSPMTPRTASPAEVKALQCLSVLLASQVGQSIHGQCLAVSGAAIYPEVST
jgi:gluconate 5-dehydrogenase